MSPCKNRCVVKWGVVGWWGGGGLLKTSTWAEAPVQRWPHEVTDPELAALVGNQARCGDTTSQLSTLESVDASDNMRYLTRCGIFVAWLGVCSNTELNMPSRHTWHV